MPLSKEINQAVQMSGNPNTCAFQANKTMLISTKRNGKIYPLNNVKNKKNPINTHTQIQRLKLCNSPHDIKKELGCKKTERPARDRIKEERNLSHYI